MIFFSIFSIQGNLESLLKSMSIWQKYCCTERGLLWFNDLILYPRPVGWDCKIRWLHLGWVVSPEYSEYDIHLLPRVKLKSWSLWNMNWPFIAITLTPNGRNSLGPIYRSNRNIVLFFLYLKPFSAFKQMTKCWIGL